MHETVGSFHRKNNPPKDFKWLGTKNSVHKLFVIHPYLWESDKEKRNQRKFIIYNSDSSVSLYQEIIDIKYPTDEIKSSINGILNICFATHQEKYKTSQDLCLINKIDITTIIGLN